MTLMIELAPEEEARLQAAAQREGIDAAELARKLLTDHLPETAGENGKGPHGKALAGLAVDKNHFYFTATPEEFERAFDALAEGNENLQVLPPEAYDRENLYEERF